MKLTLGKVMGIYPVILGVFFSTKSCFNVLDGHTAVSVLDPFGKPKNLKTNYFEVWAKPKNLKT